MARLPVSRRGVGASPRALGSGLRAPLARPTSVSARHRIERRRARPHCPKRESVVRAGHLKRWSLYGAQRSQPVAIGRKCDSRENGSDSRKPLPWVATSFRGPKMVRRGSPVRVRKRALQKRRKSALFLSPKLARSSVRRTWSLLWSLQVDEEAGKASKLPRFSLWRVDCAAHAGLIAFSRSSVARWPAVRESRPVFGSFHC